MGGSSGVNRALAGIEELALLQLAHRLDHHIERRSTSGELRLAGQQNRLQSAAVLCFLHFIHLAAQQGAGAAVDQQYSAIGSIHRFPVGLPLCEPGCKIPPF